MPEQPTIEINGALTLGELTRFHYFHLWRKSWKLGIISILLVASAAVALGNFSSTLDAFVVVWIAVIILIPYRSARKQWKLMPYLAEPLCQTFTTQTIRRTSPSISSDVNWSVVREIYETRSFFLLYISPNQALIVSKRFFPDAVTLHAWKELAKSQTPRFIEDNFIARWF